MRPVCNNCKINPRAVNYHLKGKVYYRKLCESCHKIAAKKKVQEKPRWHLAGYRKKPTCEKCGFKPNMSEQLTVYSIDRNQQHINVKNLRTVCLNCNYELSRTGWTQGDLEEDL